MGATATIRVPVDTRDRLAQLAAERGISVAKLISEFASREHIHQVYAAERRTWAVALGESEFVAELDLWSDVTGDGID